MRTSEHLGFSTTPLLASDWPLIMQIQHQVYADELHESMRSLQSKWQLSPDSCFGLKQQQQFIGYCLSHPWPIASVPSLNQVLASDIDADALFIHDLALATAAQGKGGAAVLVDAVVNSARLMQFRQVHLVAVQGSSGFWQAAGFQMSEAVQISAGYGTGAEHMVMHL